MLCGASPADTRKPFAPFPGRIPPCRGWAALGWAELHRHGPGWPAGHWVTGRHAWGLLGHGMGCATRYGHTPHCNAPSPAGLTLASPCQLLHRSFRRDRHCPLHLVRSIHHTFCHTYIPSSFLSARRRQSPPLRACVRHPLTRLTFVDARINPRPHFSATARPSSTSLCICPARSQLLIHASTSSASITSLYKEYTPRLCTTLIHRLVRL